MDSQTEVSATMQASFLERRFAIRSRGSSISREVLGGLATFLTLSYILFVQPPLMNAAAASTGGVSTESVLTAVCIASAVACVVMGLLANFPVALAPAMGHNFFFAFVVCGLMHFTFQQALMANLIAGAIFLVLSVLGMVVPSLDPRVLLFGAIPRSLQNAIAVGIGLLIALVGLEYAGVVIQQPGTGLGLGIGKVPWAPIIVAGVGLAVFGVLWARGVLGAPLWSIVASAATGALVGVVHMPQRLAALPVLSNSILNPAKANLAGLKTSDIVVVIATFLFLVVFDTVGTLAAVCRRAGLITPDGKMDKGVGAAFVADAAGTVAGAVLGTSTITSYVESLAGIQVGARTGLSALVVAALFVLAMFLAPWWDWWPPPTCCPAQPPRSIRAWPPSSSASAP